MPASSVPNIAGEKSAAITGCPACASGIAIDPAPHPISSTDSPGWSASSFTKSRAYGAVSSGRKCRALLSHSKEPSARCRAACRRIHSSFQSTESSSERASSSTTGQPPHNKKAAPPKRRAATSIYQKKNRSNAKPPYQQSGAGAKQLQSGQNPTEVPLCGSPGEGKYIRSIASSARAGEHLMCSPCESGLSEQATLYICPPRGSSPVSLS